MSYHQNGEFVENEHKAKDGGLIKLRPKLFYPRKEKSR